MNKKYLVLLYLLCFGIFVFGQKKPEMIESLTKKLTIANQDSSKVNILVKISKQYVLQGDFAKIIENSQKSLYLARKAQYKKGEAESLTLLGDSYLNLGDNNNALKNHLLALSVYTAMKNKSGIALSNNHLAILNYFQGQFPESMAYFRKALLLYEELEDSGKIADMHDNMTNIFIAEGNYPEALKKVFIAMKIREKLNDKAGLNTAYNNLGIIYSHQKKHDEALVTFKKVLQIEKEAGSEVGVIEAMANIGLVYSNQGKYEQAIKDFSTALAMAQKIDYKQVIASIYGNLGDVYFIQKNYDLSLEYINKALSVSRDMGDSRSVAGWIGNVGRIYNKKGQPALGLIELKKALKISKEIGAKEVTRDVYFDLFKSDSMLGDFKNAFENHKLYAQYKDSLFNEENTTKIVGLQKEYEFSKKEDAMHDLIETKKKEKWFFIIGILALAIIAGLLLYQREQRKKLNDKLLKSERKETETLIEIDKAKSRFLTSITHEFRTPLTLIKGNLELIKKGNYLQENEAYIDNIDHNGNRLLALINKLLDLSKLESGKYNLRFETGNIINQINNDVAMFESAVQPKNIDLSLSIDDSVILKLKQNINYTYSVEALHTIINNLMSNAIKFTPNGGEINVSVMMKNDLLILTIRDNGIGIPENQIQHIFDVFYQVEDASQYLGSGVGLSLVKELSVLHGGDVTVESQENIETVFEVSLFMGNAISKDTTNDYDAQYSINKEDFSYANQELSESHNDGDLPLILIVEDNPDVRRFIKKCLKDKFRLIEATDGKEGFESAKANVPDLIISDVMMPNIDGIKLSILLKENEITNHIPIILLTAKSGEQSKLEGLLTGVDDYLTKPFSIQELILRVSNLIRVRKVLRQKFSTALLIKPEEMDLDSKDKLFIDKLIFIINQNISDSAFGIEHLSHKINLSASQLNRKLRAITGQSTLKFIQNIRLQKAFEMLKADSDIISGIAYDTGFESAAYFTKVFKKHFGFLPSEVTKSVEGLEI